MMPKLHTIKRYLQLKWYLARNGGLLKVHGVQVSLPMEQAIIFMRLIFSGAYEAEEAEFVNRYLPADRPVIELGSSMGIISTLVRSRLSPDVPMLSVEANPHLLEVAKANVERYDPHRKTHFIRRAVAYDAGEIRFTTSHNAHGNSIADNHAGPTITVPTIRLQELVDMLGGTTDMTLVCDIEGAEWDIFERDTAALTSFETVIIEIHPARFASQGRSADGFDAMARSAGFEQLDQRNDVIVYRRK